MEIPERLQRSQALQFVISRGWTWRPINDIEIELEGCPYCQKTNWGHCYMEVHGDDGLAKRDGLHTCHRCGKGGSLYSLKQHLGVVIPTVQSRRDWAGNEVEVDKLPDTDAAHQALLEDADALDYLMNERGFSRDVIERQKVGLAPNKWFRECGEVRAIIYPYLVNGNCVYVHYRTLPTLPLSENKIPKAFTSPKGWDAPLYNGEIMRDGLTEIVFVEGEANVIAAIDKGFLDICGVPGANFKKADWIDTLDQLELEKIYICYDKDKVGQKAAQTLASRVGVERCWKIILPDFIIETEDGERQGKDLNEWFAKGGGTAEAFQKLKQDATLFDVDGVSSSKDALDELYEGLEGKAGVEPKYKSAWPSLNRWIGFDDGDVIDIMAPEKIGKTTFALNLVEHMVNNYGDDGIILCLEMTTIKLARKWVCHVTGIEDNIPQTAEQSIALKEAFMKAIPDARRRAVERPGDLYFCYPRYTTIDDLYKLMRDCIRRYGVKWIVFDNLQRACDTTPKPRGVNRTEHLSQISKTLSQIAKDYNVQIIRILQPHRIREGAMVTTDDNDGSSQVMKDCDCAITLHRNRIGEMSVKDFDAMGYVEAPASFDAKMLVTVGLSRYSSGGYTTLHYDGARSTVTEYAAGQVATIKAEANKDVGWQAQLARVTGETTPPEVEITV